MEKKFKFSAIASALSLVLVLAGCNTTQPPTNIDVAQTQVAGGTSKQASYVNDINLPAVVKLPSGFDLDDSKITNKKLAFVFEIAPLQEKNVSKLEREKANSTIEDAFATAMHNLNRFKVLSLSLGSLANESKMAQREKDLGMRTTAEQKKDKAERADLYGSGQVTFTNNIDHEVGTDYLYKTIVIDYKILNPRTHEVVYSDSVTVKSPYHEIPLLPSGTPVNSKNFDDLSSNIKGEGNALIQEAVLKALDIFKNQMYNRFPVAGRVTGQVQGKLFKTDIGTDQGVVNDQVGVLVANIDGINAPLAWVKMNASRNESNCYILKWTQDPIFAEYVKQAQLNSKAFADQYALFITTFSVNNQTNSAGAM